MNTPPKYEDLVLKIAELERRESDLMEKIARAGRVSFTFFEERDAALAREAALREELEKLRERHETVKCQRNDAQQRLIVAERALERIHRRSEMFIDDGVHMPTPSIEVIRDIAASASLKPAAEGEGS